MQILSKWYKKDHDNETNKSNLNTERLFSLMQNQMYWPLVLSLQLSFSTWNSSVYCSHWFLTFRPVKVDARLDINHL